LAAIHELGYRTNFVARSLRAQRSQMLGIIVPDASNAFYSEVMKGVEEMAYAHNYGVILGNTGHALHRQISYVESLISRQVDGIIFVTLTVEPQELALLEQFKVPAVYVDPEGNLDEVTLDHLCYISVDFDGGGYAAGRHLIEKGHRQLAAFIGKSPIPGAPTWRWHRVEGFLRAMREAELQPPVLFAGEHLEDGYRVAHELLSDSRRPTAIFSGNDLLAVGALRAAQDLGLHVPQELAICGFDDIAIAQFVNPRLTTVRLKKYEMGLQAASLVLDFLDNHNPEAEAPPSPRKLHFETELIIREST
jgi:LacI family transcriptional regulator